MRDITITLLCHAYVQLFKAWIGFIEQLKNLSDLCSAAKAVEQCFVTLVNAGDVLHGNFEDKVVSYFLKYVCVNNAILYPININVLGISDVHAICTLLQSTCIDEDTTKFVVQCMQYVNETVPAMRGCITSISCLLDRFNVDTASELHDIVQSYACAMPCYSTAVSDAIYAMTM